MNLFTDDNPKTTVKNLGFKNKEKAIESINIIENHFNLLQKKQKIPGYSPNNLLPKKYIKTKKECNNYYMIQKKYRVLGLLNRAKTIIKKNNNINEKSVKNINEAIKILNKYISNL